MAAVQQLVAPAINVEIFRGEEIGWRGFLYPRLREVVGLIPALQIGGSIWALWHAPMILWEGLNYPDHPGIGTLFFALITTRLGAALYYLDRRSGSILVPSLAHVAFNWAVQLAERLPCYNDFNYFVVGPTGIDAVCSLRIIAGSTIILDRRAFNTASRI
jgi:membrane protease YdiL (CAAX protease family)